LGDLLGVVGPPTARQIEWSFMSRFLELKSLEDIDFEWILLLNKLQELGLERKIS
jgi:hypothetical protein